MQIFIGSDHGGFELKAKIKDFLEDEKIGVTDLGAFEFDEKDDYPDFAIPVAESVSKNSDSIGILICRSGNGMCIAANKVKGAYAALCFTPHHAEMARRDDNANILCMDSDYEGSDPIKIVKAFIDNKFEGMETRHGRRFMKIKSFEEK